jgi:hypothetical protein
MTKRTGVLLSAAAVLLAGCVVSSVCPFYTEKDLVFEPAIVGSWINQNDTGETWKFERGEKLAYRFTLIEERHATVMEARAFKLEGQLFMDIHSLDQDIHVIPAHYLLKVTALAPRLRMSEVDDEWLLALLAKDPTALRHHVLQTGDKPEDRRLVLTGDTAELQKFMVQHLNTTGAWKESFDLRRASPPQLTGDRSGQTATGPGAKELRLKQTTNHSLTDRTL